MTKGEDLAWISEHEYVDALEMSVKANIDLDMAHKNLVALHNEGYLGAMSIENDQTLFGITCNGKEYLWTEVMFFKVYQDKECVDGGGFYVDTWGHIQASLEAWRELVEEQEDRLYPVIEPVLMTQRAFDELPEFDGY